MSDIAALDERPTSRAIHVEAQADHLDSLARAKPINALAELLWNAVDAGVDFAQINVEDNELNTPNQIEVVDNGLGIPLGDAERAFGNLGGSWKRGQRTTPNV